jgi:hypothetical protein
MRRPCRHRPKKAKFPALPDPEGDRTVSLVTSPTRNFTLTVEERIRALTIGPPAWAVRKRTHNRYDPIDANLPIEANLPMDRRGAYLVHGRAWVAEEPFTSARLLGMARAILARRGA